MNHFSTQITSSGETLLSLDHKSGLKIFLIPREGKEVFAIFGTKYGAMDRTFTVDGREITVPDGIAHFLEHKLFENEDGTDTLTRFGALGASANAFTSNEKTAYLFSATDNYHESLEVLLDFVTHPYFTPETVQKEQGIIGQEIRMYEDHPGYQLYFGLLNCLFVSHPIKIDIAGTVESISEITDQTLYDCYRTFYHPKNMALVLCGGFDPDRVEEICNRILPHETPFALQRTPPKEPRGILKARTERTFPVAMSQFAIGLKETENTPPTLERIAAQEIALHLYFSHESDLFCSLYEKGTLSDVFCGAYEFLDSCAFSIFQGESDTPDEVETAIKDTILRAKNTVISDEDFERARRAVYGAALQSLNSPSETATQFLSYHLLSLNLFDLPDTIASVTKEDVQKRISTWDTDLVAISIIHPKKGD